MITKEYLEEKYLRDELSVSQIAEQLNVSQNQISYWLKKHGIQKRTIRDAVYKRINPSGDPFSVKLDLSEYEKFLLGLGLGLFWGEGMKLNKHGVRLGNTDPFIILYFREFLEVICGVKKEKIKYSLQAFGDVEPVKIKCFWTEVLSISEKQLGKISIIKHRGKGTYKRKNKFGVMQIACYNRNLKQIIDTLIRTLKISQYAVVAQLVEHVHGETHESLAQMLRN